MADPLPTLTDLNQALQQGTNIHARSSLDDDEYRAFYTAFCASNGAGFNTPALNRAAYLAFLARIANVGGSEKADAEGGFIKTTGVQNGEHIQTITRAIKAVVPGYTHLRLMRTKPDHVARAITLNLPDGTEWGDNNGLIDVPVKWQFPGAQRCTGVSGDIKLRIAAASRNALGAETTNSVLNAGLKQVTGYLAANAQALNNPRMQLTYS